MQTKNIHQPEKYLVSIIQNVNSLRLKIKLADWYHRLTHGPKYGPSLSLIGAMTSGIVFQLIIIYIGFFIFILSHF
nr:uncharacterized protein LOC113790248 [Dermatophagoides pteronyssinus]